MVLSCLSSQGREWTGSREREEGQESEIVERNLIIGEQALRPEIVSRILFSCTSIILYMYMHRSSRTSVSLLHKIMKILSVSIPVISTIIGPIIIHPLQIRPSERLKVVLISFRQPFENCPDISGLHWDLY